MSRPKPTLHVIEGSGATPRDGARPPPRIRLIDAAGDPRRPGGARDAGGPGLRRGAEMSAALHLAILALLVLFALFQSVPQPRYAAIDVTFVQIGEGEGREAPRPGVHAAQPEATPGAAPPAPELTAPPGTEEKPAAAGAPEQAAQTKSEEQAPPQPPKAEPTPQPQPAEPKPQVAETAPQAAETVPPPETEPQAAETAPKPPESPPSASETPAESAPAQSAELAPPKPAEEAPKEPEGILPPQAATTPETKPEESKPQTAARAPEPAESKPQTSESALTAIEPKPKPPVPTETAEVTPPKPAQAAPAPQSASPPRAAPVPEEQVALAPVPRPELPKLPSASKLRDEYARAEPTDLPPASKLIEAPRAGAAHLPPRSEFKPGSPGDTRRAEAVGRAAGPPGEVGGTGDAIQSGGRPGTPGPGGGGGGGGDPIQLRISELQARIDRLLLVYGPDYPDVVALQREIDQLYAKRGPLSPKELAEARRQLTECWAHASGTLGMANKAIDLSLVLNRDGSVREATLGGADAHEAVSPERLLDAIRACGPLSLPPERYLLWQRLNMRVGVS
jgi:hypothetical protein